MQIPYSIGFYNAWQPAAVYLILNFAYTLLLPKYKIKDFILIPRVKYVTVLNHLLYGAFLIFCIFIPLKTGTVWIWLGLSVFTLGLLFYSLAMFNFAVSEFNRPATTGIYKYSRHPVYVSFFMMACGIATSSLSVVLFLLAGLHFLVTLKLIKIEEKECLKRYKEDYESYRNQTGRILGYGMKKKVKRK